MTIWAIRQTPGTFGNLLRARYLAPRMKSAGSNLTVMAGCRFRSIRNLEVGDNVTIGFDNFIQARGGVRIGSNVGLGPGVQIWSVSREHSDPDAAAIEQGKGHKPVVIENNVFIASNAFVLPGATIPEGCIVSAGAVVGGTAYHPFSILGGNPARIIGYRGGRSPAQEVEGEQRIL